MPKMTHWNSADTIDVSGEKAAVYAAQGWVSVDKVAKPASVTAMTTAAVDEPAKPAPAKKAAAKKATKKAAKKS